jgi:hypothetical protein
MGWTILLSLLVGLSQFGTGFLGWRLTNRPPRQRLTQGQRRLYDVIFFVCGAIGIGSGGMLAYLSGRLERAHFALDLNSKVQAVAGSPLSMRIGFENVGTGPSINTDSYSRSFIQGDESRRSADDAIAQFKEYARNRTVGTDNVPKGATGYYMVAQGNVLSDQDVLDLVHNVRVMYVVGTIKFKDDFGHHTQYICKTLQRPVSANGASWGTCGIWDDEE